MCSPKFIVWLGIPDGYDSLYVDSDIVPFLASESGIQDSELEVRMQKIGIYLRQISCTSPLSRSLSKHLAANKKVSFASQKKSSGVPIVKV